MSSEASKIRAQCARKFGLREKSYKERIKSLQAELDAANVRLKDYDDMKRIYLKLLIYCGLNEKDRERVLRSQEIDETIDQYAGFLGMAGSKVLRKVAHQVFAKNCSLTLADVIKQAEVQGLLDKVAEQESE